MPTIRANGLDLAYQIDGDGPETLVLVNGLADAKESWEAQIPAFSERYRVISFDNRGIGESPDLAAGPVHDWEKRPAMRRRLVGRALGGERFHLLGVSMGGMIAQEYAIAHADRLLSATFACTYSYPGPFCLRMFQCWRDLVPTLGVGFTQREVILWAFTTDFFEQREDELAAFEAEMANNPQPIDAYLAQLHSIERHDTRRHSAGDSAHRHADRRRLIAVVTRSSRAACTTSCRARPGPRWPAATAACGIPGRLQRRRPVGTSRGRGQPR